VLSALAEIFTTPVEELILKPAGEKVKVPPVVPEIVGVAFVDEPEQ
jgi:hypothetical protein